MPKLPTPLTLPKHGPLLHEINETIIDLKIQDEANPLTGNISNIAELRAKHKKHSVEDLCRLLQACYYAINEQREDPRKY